MVELSPWMARREVWLSHYGPEHNPQTYQAPRERSDYDRRDDPDSFVYFIRREKLIKIGYSIDPVRRAGDLGGVVLATIPGERQVERSMHLMFAHLRDHGEWFRPGDDLLAYINVLRARLKQPAIAA